MRKLLLCVAALVLTATVTFTLRPRGAVAGPQPDSTILRAIRTYRAKTWNYETIMGARLTPSRASAPSLAALAKTWRTHAARAAREYDKGPAHLRQWLCIHHFEGSWRDPNSPYYGGLQMNISFQRTYGWALLHTKGTADHWTPLEQMWVAEKAYRSGRGFYPWPNTARYCGLI
ncbi:MAG: lysozyme family protein [Gaiellaceae bacterium]